MTVDAEMIDATNIRFIITVSNSHWASLGFGTSMTNVDMVSIQTPGTPTILDHFSTGTGTPPIDTTNDYILESTTASGTDNIYKIKRPLNTGDSDDFTITKGTVHSMVWAHKGGAFGYHGISYGKQLAIHIDSSTNVLSIGKSITVNSDGTITASNAEDKSLNWYQIHGIGLYITWGALTFVMIVTGRYFKAFYKLRIIVHAVTGTCILILSIIFATFARRGKEEGRVPVQNKLSHKAFGNTMYGLVCGAVVTGYSIKILMYFLSCFCSSVGVWKMVWL
jgi:hypothetical protein